MDTLEVYEEDLKTVEESSPYHNEHYMEMPVEPFDLMRVLMTKEEFLGFLKGNIIKYALRAGRKKGVSADDDVDKYTYYKELYKELTIKGYESYFLKEDYREWD